MRSLRPYLEQDLTKKMVFLGGPRQCGKTTLALDLLRRAGRGRYFLWDLDEDRDALRKKHWSDDDRLLVFDELHKFPRWKNWIKGVFDTQRQRHRMLVTGSARLDVYRRGGDSLLGRYHYWRLHPFSLTELPKGIPRSDALQRLLRVGGFPEPFLDGNEQAARRWRRERLQRVVRDDLRDLETIRDLGSLQLLLDALRARVGSTIVTHHLAQDLQVADRTIKHWIELLERMYVLFVVRPYTQRLPRAVQKPPKIYFYDNADVIGDEGARFENLVATHLLKRLQFLEDRDGYRYELRYVRDKEGREVDFVVTCDGNVTELYEAKWSDPTPAKALLYYAEKLKPTVAVQLLGTPTRTFRQGAFTLASALEMLTPAWGESLAGARYANHRAAFHT